MSSLLDILHRKDSRATVDEAVEPATDSAAQTVELRLAIDNGPITTEVETAPHSLAADAPDVQSVAGQDAAYAPSAPPGDATLVLTARQLRSRSRRSTAWLGAGLVLIVIGAGVATWLLNETSGLTGNDDSLFSAPAAGAPVTAGPVPGPIQRATEAVTPAIAATKPADVARKPAVPDTAGADTAWFDTPAEEASSGDAGVDATDSAAEPIRIVRGTTTNPLFGKLTAAWTAFQAADYAGAEALWREVRAAEPANVDALLGLGALAARGGRLEEARELYQAVLLAEPRNAAAISAMSMLPASGSRNLDESTLKNLLRDQPGAGNLHFALGLQYVAQGRWPDAQIAFFDAVRTEPANADYAYNLAVSLDQLGQSAPAAAYYQRALELATASALFNTGAATERLSTLRSAPP